MFSCEYEMLFFIICTSFFADKSSVDDQERSTISIQAHTIQSYQCSGDWILDMRWSMRFEKYRFVRSKWTTGYFYILTNWKNATTNRTFNPDGGHSPAEENNTQLSNQEAPHPLLGGWDLADLIRRENFTDTD